MPLLQWLLREWLTQREATAIQPTSSANMSIIPYPDNCLNSASTASRVLIHQAHDLAVPLTSQSFTHHRALAFTISSAWNILPPGIHNLTLSIPEGLCSNITLSTRPSLTTFLKTAAASSCPSILHYF